MSAKEIGKDLEAMFKPKTIEAARGAAAEYSAVDKALSGIESAAKSVARPLATLDNSFQDGSKGVSAFNTGIQETGKSLARIAEVVSPAAAGQILQMANQIASMNEQISIIGETIDSSSDGIRSYRSEMFEMSSGFGKGYEESQKFAQNLAELSSQITNSSEISFSDLKKAANNAANSFGSMGLQMEDLFKTVETGAGSFNVLEASILLAKRTGDDTRVIMQSVTKAVREQGVSVEGAIEQYSSFFSTAEKTGLKVDEVRQALEGTASSYKKIGLNADFARPLLETFARSLSSAGLGISNATGLSQNLSRSFMDVANSYEKAYLMVQKGGLDVGTAGSGGVLGASIGLRARILQAEETGDQSKIGLEMAEAMKKTLEGFTGGKIIDIQEAADNPALTQQYFKQESLMKSMFGLGGDDAARTAEMLKKLDDTTVMSNEDLKNELGKNINEQIKNQDKNLGYQERIANSAENMFASSVLTNEILLGMADTSNTMAKNLAETQAGSMSAMFKTSEDLAVSTAGQTEAGYNFAINRIKEMSDAFDDFKKPGGALTSQTITDSPGGKTYENPAEILLQGLQEQAETITAGESAIVTAINKLSGSLLNPDGSLKIPTDQ